MTAQCMYACHLLSHDGVAVERVPLGEGAQHDGVVLRELAAQAIAAAVQHPARVRLRTCAHIQSVSQSHKQSDAFY